MISLLSDDQYNFAKLLLCTFNDFAFSGQSLQIML